MVYIRVGMGARKVTVVVVQKAKVRMMVVVGGMLELMSVHGRE